MGVAKIRATGQVIGKVEFNPSRVIDPEGVGLVDVAQAVDALQLVWAAAGELVEWGGPIDTAKVKRLDVARDFTDIEKPAELIRALSPIHRPWARKNLVHADASRNGAQTLVVGGGASSVRLYDKWAETKGQAAPGTVRWEAECRSGWSSSYGEIERVRDLSGERAEMLARDRWEWSAMGVEVAGTARVIDKVRRSELSEREQANFLGWLLMQANGGAWAPAKATLAKYRKVQRDLGIALADIEDRNAGVVTRLDFESGREVLRVA